MLAPDRPAAPLTPAIGYVRVSMLKEEAISPQTQRTAIEACAARDGFTVVKWVEDLDVSGRNFKRKIIGVIEMIKGEEAEAIIVWKFSRFGRQRKGNNVYIAELEEAGGRLVSATEAVDVSTATGRFQRGILLEVSAYESERAGEIWAETYGWRVREGLPPFGRPRFGYRREGRVRDEDDPQRTRHVKGMTEKYVPDAELGSDALVAAYGAYTGGKGFHAVAGELNAGGWLTAYGGRWRASGVKDVLDSGFGAGLLQLHDAACGCKRPGRCPRRVYLVGAHKAVITPEEWQAYLARRRQVASLPPRSRNARYSVTGLVRCGHCRSAMVAAGTAGRDTVLFACSRARNYGDGSGCEGRPALGVNRIEAAVRKEVAKWAADIDAAKRDIARETAKRDAAGAVARLEDILAGQDKRLVQLALHRAADADAGGILGDDVWRKAAEEARAERDKTAASLEAARAEAARAPAPALAPVMAGVMESWDTLPPDARNRALRTVVRRIVVYREGERERGPDGWWRLMPARIEVVPVWEPDPWDGDMPRQGKTRKV